jgi:flagellar hook assembly protein FlgD
VKTSRLVRALFAVLVVATVGAFFVTQELKTEVPVVLRFSIAPRDISPNDDGVRDRARVGFDLHEPATVTLSVIDQDGQEVRRLVDDRRLPGDSHNRFRFDGRDDSGKRLPDGRYRLRVQRRSEGRSLDSVKVLRIDTAKPRVAIASARPGVVDPSEGKRVRIRVSYSGPRNKYPEYRVWRTDDGPPRIVRRFRGFRSRSVVWDGRVISGQLAVDGNYTFQVRIRDKAGNQTIAPADPPTVATARPHTGVAFRRLTLRGPMIAVPAGGLVRLRVGPTSRRFEFAVSRLGSGRNIRRDTRRGGLLRVKIPESAHTGVYLVRVRARGHRAVWPLAVQGKAATARAADRERPLLVLPAITWQGLNPFDSDLDGFGDTLLNSRSVPIERPFQGGGLPPRFGSEIAPLLEFLDRSRLAYDITTDVALARREGPALGNATGAAIAGTAMWVPRVVRDRLLGGVKVDGQAVAVFGGQSLRRSVAVVKGRLRDPSLPRPDDVFGERTRTVRGDLPAPLRVLQRGAGLFDGVDDLFGEFSVFERSLKLPAGARLVASAGRDEEEPAFVAYRLGKGVVIRPGTPQWPRQLEERALGLEVPRVTRNIWRLLSR